MSCVKCHSSDSVIKKGWVQTRKRAKKVQRYSCKDCGLLFTSRNAKSTYKEKRPDLNKRIRELYVEGMPLRAIARVLNCDYKTVVRKFIKYGELDVQTNKLVLPHKCRVIQIDEMYSFIGKRGNSVYIALAVAGHGQILSFQCSQVKRDALEAMMRDLEGYVDSETIFYSDKDVSYQGLLEKFYPQADYVILHRWDAEEFLKYLSFVCALVRNRLGRMSRKSWCFSRDVGRLQLNLEMLMRKYNSERA